MFACILDIDSVGCLYWFSHVYRSYHNRIVDKAWLFRTRVIFNLCRISIPRLPDARSNVLQIRAMMACNHWEQQW